MVSVAVGKLAATAQLDVYPDPAPTAQAAHLDYRNLPAVGGMLLAYSQTGQVVYSATLTETSARLTLPTLPGGLYNLVLRNRAGLRLATQRLVVSNH